jgi:hypothetical protein
MYDDTAQEAQIPKKKKTIFAQISRSMNDKIVPREDQKTAN